MICAACGRENRDGARFCDACGEALSARCAACHQELRPDARFCDACGAPTGEAGQGQAPATPTVSGSRKVVTVVFADLAGSTSLQERMDAESVRRTMDRFYDAMRAVVSEHDGTVVKFMGDGLMVAFGVPTVAEDDAARAVRAAAAMQDAFVAVADAVRRDWGAHVGLRVGVNTGEVVVAEGEDDVVGDAVNVAARLEHAAGESEVLVGQETWRLTRDLFTFEAVAPLELKGKAEPVPGFRLVSLDAARGEAASPFVGRERELTRLVAAFDAAVQEQRAHLVTVIGSPGLGKSRLVRELARRLAGRAGVFEGQCEPSGASTFAPVADVLRQAVAIEESASPDEITEALQGLFSDGDDDAARVAASAATVLGVAGSVSPEETFWAVRRVFEQVAAERPAVVVFDDVHWAEPMLLDLVEHLAEWTRGVPVLIVAVARPEIRDVRTALADPTSTPSDVVVLDALHEQESMRLASELLEGHPLDGEVAARLLASAEGNPLFLRELVKMLLEDGVLHLEGGVWTAAEGTEIDVPPTIHALLSARIERLGPDERSVVERASVVGQQFFRGAVAVLSPPPVASQLDSHLETLRRKEVVEPEGTYWIDEPVFRFHHALIRDAAYRRLLKEARADLHERVAEWLTQKAGDFVGEHEEVIGYHLEQALACRRDLGTAREAIAELGSRAAVHLGAAARRALDRDDLRSAAALMGRAVACLPPGDPTRAELLVDRCEALLGLGEITAGAEALAELRAASERSPRLAAWAEAFAAQVASFLEPEALPDWVDRAAAAADRLEELGDPVGTAKAAAVHASILARLGMIGGCETALDRALAAAREAGDRRRANGVLAGAPLAALWGPSPVTRAAGRCLDVVRVLRITTDSPPVEAVALRAQGVLEAFRGRFDAARRLLASSRRTLEELGHRHGILQTELFAGLVELSADDPAAAEAPLRKAYEGFRALRVGADTAQAAAILARACLAQGRDDEALALTEESERLGGHDLKTAIAWRAVRAEALARRGQVEEALRLAREAVDVAAETDALVDHADARLALAAVLSASGDAARAAEEAQRAAELYDTKGATALAERARRLLAPVGERRPPGEHAVSEVRVVPSGHDAGSAVDVSDLHAGSLALRAWAGGLRATVAGDLDGLLALMADDVTYEERTRTSGLFEPLRGKSALAELYSIVFTGQVDFPEAEVLATRGTRLVLTKAALRWTDGVGQASEHLHLRLDETDEDGLIVASILFEADDLDAAFDELDERFRAHVDPECRPILEASTDNRKAYNAHDWEAMRSLLADDAVFVDHRPAGWGTLDPDGYIERLRGFVPLAPDVRTYSVDCAELAPGCVLSRMHSSGTDAQGGAFAVPLEYLATFTNGKFQRVEYFDPSQRNLARARFHELTAEEPGGLGSGNLAVAAWRQYVPLLERNDLDAISALQAPGYVFESRLRRNVMDTSWDRDGIKELAGAVFDGGHHFHYEVLAVRGRRLALGRVVEHIRDATGGDSEIEWLQVDETDESGLVSATVCFEPDDFDLAMDELDDRYRGHVEPECVPLLDTNRANRHAYNVRDWEAFRATLADDFVLTDHRPGWFGPVGGDDYVNRVRSLVELAPDARIHTSDIARVAPHCVLGRLGVQGADRDGGPFEIVIDVVSVVVDGQFRRIEFFDPADRARAVARFEELVRERESTHHNVVLAVWDRYRELFLRHDVDGILATISADYHFEERQFHAQHTSRGREGFRSLLEAIFESQFVGVEMEVVATRGARLAMVRVTWHVRARSGGELEVAHLRVDEADDDGLLCSGVAFEPGDFAAAMRELDERFLRHVDPACTSTFDLSRTSQGFVDRRDWAALRATVSDDFRLIDHRLAGFGERNADQYVEGIQAMVEMAPDVTSYTEEVIRLAPNIRLARSRSSGTDSHGGRFEHVVDDLGVFKDGKLQLLELFDPAQLDQALARFDELVAAAPDDPYADNLALAAWRRAKVSLQAGQVEPILAMVAADVVYEERRSTPGRFVLTGADELGHMLTTMARNPPTAIDTEVVATRGTRVVLTRNVFHGADTKEGGEFESVVLRLDETDEAGRFRATIVFDPDDLDAAFEELDARYRAQLPPTCWPHLDVTEAAEAAHRSRDVQAYRALLADDFVAVDHRASGWGSLNADDYCAHLAGLFELADAITARQIESEMTEGVGYGRTQVVATGLEGGTAEIAFCGVVLISDGKFSRIEFFDLEERERARARFHELIAVSQDQQGEGSFGPRVNAATRMQEVCARLLEVGDVDAVLEHISSEFTLVERRLSSREALDRAGYQSFLETIAGGLRGFRFDVDLVATRGDRWALSRLTAHMRDQLDGEAEVAILRLDEVDDRGRNSRAATFEVDDLEAACDTLDEWFRESLPPEERGEFDRVVAGRKAYNARDWKSVRSLFADDFVLVDHRPGWFGTLDADGYVERLQGILQVAPDATLTAFDVPRVGAEAAVVGWSTRGTGAEGGPFEITFYSVTFSPGGRTNRFEFYPVEALEKALARFEQFAGAGAGAGAS